MSEETTQAVEPKVETTEVQETTAPVENKTFNQDQLNNIVQQRLEAEKRKHENQLAEIKKQEEEALKEKEIKEAKSKQELEKLMQQRIAEKETEILSQKLLQLKCLFSILISEIEIAFFYISSKEL